MATGIDDGRIEALVAEDESEGRARCEEARGGKGPGRPGDQPASAAEAREGRARRP